MRRKKIQACLTLITILLSSFLSLGVKQAQAASASLYLAPASGTHVINGTFNVAVKVNSGGVEVNAAEGVISYDSSLLEVTGISKGGTIFPFWTAEPSFNNSAGTINFGGGMPPPAYTGSAGQICTVTFKAKKVGTASVRFTSGAVLANDGKGTNVLASMGSGSYVISPKVEAPPATKTEEKTTTVKEEPKVEVVYNLPKIESPSHPDSSLWYNNNKADFKWALPEGVTGVSVVLDKEATTDPGFEADGLFDAKTYENVEDGSSFLHLKFKDSKRWGTLAHYQVMIDTALPEAFAITVKETSVGEWPELQFATKDELSGLDRYEVHVGSLEKEAIVLEADKTSFKVSDLGVGEQTVIVRAIDKAGNERLVSAHFTINPIDAPIIVNYPTSLKATDKFYMNGSAPIDSELTIYVEDGEKTVIEDKIMSDAEGNWFFISEQGLANGRYVAWAVAENKNGIKSNPSQKVSFLVSAPVFAVIGSVVVNYFTVFVSLLFMIILIVFIIIYIIGFVRRKLKKETLEVEVVLKKNAVIMQKTIETEFAGLSEFEGKKTYEVEKEKAKKRLLAKVEDNTRKSMKEIRDVENILK